VAVLYLDTSALVKRYAVERGTAWIVRLTAPSVGHVLYTVRLTRVETIAALYRKVRTGQLAAVDAQRAEAIFTVEWRQQYQVLEPTEQIVDRAALLARSYPLRAYDAVHLAAALALEGWSARTAAGRVTFISADLDQLHAARSEGLLVDDPNVQK
jgi:predicted nucleic acid-binding protein